MAGKYSRRKGVRGEQEVAKLLQPIFPEVRTKRAGGESANIDRGRDLLGTPGLCVQVKCMANPAPIKAINEARKACLENEIALAFVKVSNVGRGNSSPWMVIVDAEHFIGLWNIAQRYRLPTLHPPEEAAQSMPDTAEQRTPTDTNSIGTLPFNRRLRLRRVSSGDKG